MVKVAVLKESEDYDDYESWKENFEWELVFKDNKWYYLPHFVPFNFTKEIWCINCKSNKHIRLIPKNNKDKFRSFCEDMNLSVYEAKNNKLLNYYSGPFSIVETEKVFDTLDVPILSKIWGRKIAVYPK